MTFIGVDCGTSALKAILIDGEGRTLASAESAYRPDHPHPLWSEQDPNVWREAMFAALGRLRGDAPAACSAARAILLKYWRLSEGVAPVPAPKAA